MSTVFLSVFLPLMDQLEYFYGFKPMTGEIIHLNRSLFKRRHAKRSEWQTGHSERASHSVASTSFAVWE